MNIDDIKLKTIANKPYIFNGITIKPKSLGEIIEYGYDNYNQKLGIVSVLKEDAFPKEVLEDIPEEISLVELMTLANKHEFLEDYFEALKYFTNSNTVYFLNGKLYFDDKSIDPILITDLVKIIKIQNCLVTPDEETFNPLNERAKRIKQKMLENKKKIKELKESEESEDRLTLLDLISILCSNANGINLSNVFDLNMFQFSDQFNRMKMIDEYEVNIQALLHGGDSKNIKLKHWMSKVK